MKPDLIYTPPPILNPPHPKAQLSMITRFITDVSTTFNPFAKRAKICRIFLSQFGPATFRNVKFNTKLLPQTSTEPSVLKIKFQDGKEMDLDPEKLNIKDIFEEVDRHSRALGRKADLTS
ncbi:MAG: 39S ribosomal protein L44, mitochondrial [Stictis urceolatum]|nr:39S ribosomal protein L44, mitochondrial [Stictis urceolata]